jgi:uncharacterized protein
MSGGQQAGKRITAPSCLAVAPMSNISFLSRKTGGQSHYLLLAMACLFALAFLPSGVRRALDANTLNPAAWLPSSYGEVQDLAWFREHFPGEDFAVVTWDGCTLGDDEQLDLLAKKLSPVGPAAGVEGTKSQAARNAHWYLNVVTGPQLITQMMRAQIGLSYSTAAKRLEGALVGPQQRDATGRSLGDESRPTCLIVSLSRSTMGDARTMREAVAGITEIAAEECGIDPATIHMGGAPVDGMQISAESQRTAIPLAATAAIVGSGLCFWRLGSVRLTAIVLAVAVVSAALSVAIVSYFGAYEVLALGRPSPGWGTFDAVLIAMPAIVCLLATSAALHCVNYYLEARRETGIKGAAESAVRMAWRPALTSAIATAAGLAALAASDIVPVQKFGVFAAASIVAATGAILAMLPVLLHRFPLSNASAWRKIARRDTSRLIGLTRGMFQFVVQHNAASLACGAVVIATLGVGLTKLTTSVQVLNLLDRDSDLVSDYAWIERNIGNLIPVEVVITMPPERLRAGDEHAEQDGQQYRLTMLERIELLRDMERRLEEFPQISRALSAATFTPPATRTGLAGANRGGDFAKNKVLESNRPLLLDGDYLRMERDLSSDHATGRELWRLTARVAAQAPDGGAVDYEVLLKQMQQAVEPVLLACQQRDRVVRALHEQGKQLAGSKVCVLFRAPDGATAPPAEVQERALAELLGRSGLAPRGVSYYNLAMFETPNRGGAAQDQQYRQLALASLRKQDAVILAAVANDPAARMIAEGGVTLVDVTSDSNSFESSTSPVADDGGPRPIRAVMTGLAPVVAQTQSQLLATLRQAFVWAAALTAVAVALGLMSVPAGMLAMAPSLAPLAAVFGALGWLGVKIDLGIMMTAAVALGLAIEGTIHFSAWFRSSLALGVSRHDAVLRAYDKCGLAMIEGALIGCLGLSVLCFSAFTPVREFGYLMPAMLVASLAGNLLLLPAILASPAGWFFASTAMRREQPLWAELKARKSKQPAATPSDAPTLPLPQPPRAPHFVDEPQPARRPLLNAAADERRELADGPHAALHAKLQQLRRPRTGDSTTS